MQHFYYHNAPWSAYKTLATALLLWDDEYFSLTPIRKDVNAKFFPGSFGKRHFIATESFFFLPVVFLFFPKHLAEKLLQEKKKKYFWSTNMSENHLNRWLLCCSVASMLGLSIAPFEFKMSPDIWWQLEHPSVWLANDFERLKNHVSSVPTAKLQKYHHPHFMTEYVCVFTAPCFTWYLLLWEFVS